MDRKKQEFSIVDLFAGCGGLSEGFAQAGFQIIAQIEMDRWACETLRTRKLYYQLKEMGKESLYWLLVKGEINRQDIFRKFPEIEKAVLYSVIQAEFGKEKFEDIIEKIEETKKIYCSSRVQVVVGGPPCQPYSVVGRSRDPDRMELDNRNYLYEYYLKILGNLQPDFFVFENVPGLITAHAKGEKIFAKLLSDFRNISPPYAIAPSFDEYSRNPRQYLLDSCNFGVPQKRKRVIFIGYKESIIQTCPSIEKIFQKILKPKPSRLWGYDVSSAIGDLPSLKPGEGDDHWYGEYCQKPISPYQYKMRRGSQGLLNHRARTHMSSDLDRYRFFILHHLNGNGSATLTDLIGERPDLTPAHTNLDKFLDRFKVQWWNRPSSTITAHLCKDGHHYIHPDISQCRSFTVREAARCQSFPDNFKFEGPRTEQFRQVGNAVPPSLAYSIAQEIARELRKIYGE